MPNPHTDEASLALFCDFENVALGVRDAKYDKFDIGKILERLLLKGSIVVKKAYCDWERYKSFKAQMHEASFELIEIPHVRQSGKNSADIRMVVDALDLCYTKSHVDTFVIISGDSDFSPLVSKLRENAKRVIGVGVKNSTSDLLIACCDEFIYYDDLVRERRKPVARKAAKSTAAAKDADKGDKAEKPDKADKAAGKAPAKGRGAARSARAEPAAAPHDDEAAQDTRADDAGTRSEDDRRQDAIDYVTDTVEALVAERGGDDKIWGSMIKQALKRRRPGFNESFYGYRSFNELLEDARNAGFVSLEPDDKSGGYLVRLSAVD